LIMLLLFPLCVFRLQMFFSGVDLHLSQKVSGSRGECLASARSIRYERGWPASGGTQTEFRTLDCLCVFYFLGNYMCTQSIQFKRDEIDAKLMCTVHLLNESA
jgi:hypothetical protein